jgi:hypothetical protein
VIAYEHEAAQWRVTGRSFQDFHQVSVSVKRDLLHRPEVVDELRD